MTPGLRSAAGALMMILIIPIFAGLLACMPVPVGDPEKSRIDPFFSGIWLLASEDQAALYFLQPYDKRTWLMVGVDLAEGPDADFSDEEPEFDDEADRVAYLFDFLRKTPVGPEGVTSTSTAIFKVWRTKLGGVSFMTWEPVGGFDAAGRQRPEYWWVWKVEQIGTDRFELYLCCDGGEIEAFDDLPEPGTDATAKEMDKARRAWERVLRKHAGNPDIYAEETSVFYRLPADLTAKASALFQQTVEFE